ncbi:SpaA isopeptide-forming pilin-related protein [Enterococcus ureasiticus]|uniref:VWFA domain-containing protein n=1 Tax=Enterococcus ureasiticus TaxID=903984 RepID=A0A1E5GEZ6_9ENTE|nr:SpaA isopeptide-forming pilin-related protein [Enterococcus ureasiticus]OEG11278.1 hypothetical protein BCR21_08210 [Enterococcus ureasiticus]
MIKKFNYVIFICLVAFISLMPLFLSVTSQADSKNDSFEEVELINSEDLFSRVEYVESGATISWKLFVTKEANLSNRSLSIGIYTEGTALEAPIMLATPEAIFVNKKNRFEEIEKSKEKASYVFEFTTEKNERRADGKLTIELKLSSFNENGDEKVVIDGETAGHFVITPKPLENVGNETSNDQEKATIISGEESESESKTYNKITEQSLRLPEITLPIDENVFPALKGQSILAEIEPYFTNVSLEDPFAYLTDTLGKYQGHNNGINQGTEVRNYNYSQLDTTALITGRDRPTIVKHPTMTGKTLDFTTGYHGYSGAYLKKWAEPARDQNNVITDPTLFNIYLEVIGDVNTVTVPIDIILVLDKSGSMDESIGSETKDTQLRTSVRNFSNSLLTAGLDIKIGLVNYGSTSGDGDGGTPYSQTEALTATATTINNSTVLTRNPVGYTPTSLGLTNGLTALYGTGSRAAAKKIMVFLSDGAPTKFYKPVEVRSRLVGPPVGAYTAWGEYLATNNGTTPGVSAGPLYNYDGTTIAANEKFPNRFVSTTGLPALSADGKTQYDYRWGGYQWLGTGYSGDGNGKLGMIYTLGHANWLFNQDPKYANISLYSIGLGIGGTDEISVMGRNTLKNLAKNVNNYYSADTQGQLVTIFSNIAANIVKTVQTAHVVDPLGNAVSLVGEPKIDSFSVTATGNTAWAGTTATNPKQFVTLTKSAGNRGLEWQGIMLGKNEGLRFSYQVQLNEPYQSGLFQQANAATYLENGTTSTGPPYDTTNRLHFAIPSVRYKGLTSIKVKKIWSDADNTWSLRTPVTLQLQRAAGTGTYQNVDGKNLTIQPTATGNQLETTFSGLEKFDATGQRYTYQVIENAVPNGYSPPVYSDQNLTATNTLLTTSVSFKKVGHDGQTPLPNITFELTAPNGKKVQAISDVAGTVTFTGIPIGTHSITEVTTPSGYQPIPAFKVVVTKTTDTALGKTYDMTGINAEMFKLTGQDLTLVNRYQKGKFTFKKVGNDGIKPLSQVKFSLLQNSQLVKEATSATDGTVLFDDIYPGSYTLREISTVNGYSLIGDLNLVVTKDKTGANEFIVQGLPTGAIVTNRLKNFKLSLNKVAVDNAQKAIKGAEFTLYQNGMVLEKQLSAADGKVNFSQTLEPAKNYTVKETAVPKGYLPITGTFTIQVKADGNIVIDYNGTVLTAQNGQLAVSLTGGTENNTIQYTVTNDPKRPLPRTGGSGIYAVVTSGIAAMSLGIFIYQVRGRKEENGHGS